MDARAIRRGSTRSEGSNKREPGGDEKEPVEQCNCTAFSRHRSSLRLISTICLYCSSRILLLRNAAVHICSHLFISVHICSYLFTAAFVSIATARLLYSALRPPLVHPSSTPTHLRIFARISRLPSLFHIAFSFEPTKRLADVTTRVRPFLRSPAV